MDRIEQYFKMKDGEFYHFSFPEKTIIVQYREDDFGIVCEVAKSLYKAYLRKEQRKHGLKQG